MATRKSVVLFTAAALVVLAGPSVAASPRVYFEITPCRVVDTRACGFFGDPYCGTGPSFGQKDYTIQGKCGVPLGAVALTLNATVVTPTAAGFLKLWPFGTTEPTVSTLNYVGGNAAIANGATVPLAILASTPNNDLSVRIAVGPGSAYLVIDVTGYFSDAPAASLFGRFGGDGHDGTPDFSAGGTITGARKQYASLVIPSGQQVFTNQPFTFIAAAHCDIRGTLRSIAAPNGGSVPGLGAQAGRPGIDGGLVSASPNPVYACAAGAGGAGGGAPSLSGGSGGGAHGAGGTPSIGASSGNSLALSALTAGAAGNGAGDTKTDSFAGLLSCAGGGGGSGAYGGPSANGTGGGLGGNGGGVIYLECGDFFFPALAQLSATGDQGFGAGSEINGGGGAGGGGVILVRTQRILVNQGNVFVSSNGGGAGIGGGSNGLAGVSGFYDIVQVP